MRAAFQHPSRAPRLVTIIGATFLCVSSFSSACNRKLPPEEADLSFSRLDQQKVVSLCGKDKKGFTNTLEYEGGVFFVFEDNGLHLMTAGDKGGKITWVNVRRSSTNSDPSLRSGWELAVFLSKSMAETKGISVYEYEGTKALKLMDRLPCLSGAFR